MLSTPAHCITPAHSSAPQRRYALTTRFTKVQNALLYATDRISDGAFRTYAVLISHDFQDSATRRYKGTVTVSIEDLMCLRGKGRSTLYSHLQELEEAGLIAMTPHGIELYQLAQDNATEEEVGEELPAQAEAYPSPEVQNSGQTTKELVEDIYITNSVQSSEAETLRRDYVKRKLRDLDIPEWIAHKLLSRYDVEKVHAQLVNLAAQQSHGITIRKPLQWLQSALCRDFAPYTPPTSYPKTERGGQESKPQSKPIGSFVEVLSVDGFYEMRWVEAPAAPHDEPADAAFATDPTNLAAPTGDTSSTDIPTARPTLTSATRAPQAHTSLVHGTDCTQHTDARSRSPHSLLSSPKPAPLLVNCKSLSAMKTAHQNARQRPNRPALSLSTYPCISEMQETETESAGPLSPPILAASHIECSRRAWREQSNRSYPGVAT
jgi:hypothetical protein